MEYSENLLIFKKRFCAIKRKSDTNPPFVYFSYVLDLDETAIYLKDTRGKVYCFPISEIISIEETKPKHKEGREI